MQIKSYFLKSDLSMPPFSFGLIVHGKIVLHQSQIVLVLLIDISLFQTKSFLDFVTLQGEINSPSILLSVIIVVIIVLDGHVFPLARSSPGRPPSINVIVGLPPHFDLLQSRVNDVL